MGNRKNGYPLACRRDGEENIYCEDFVHLKLQVTSKRGRRRIAKVLAPDARLTGHVILDRALAGSYTWHGKNLEIVPSGWVSEKDKSQ